FIPTVGLTLCRVLHVSIARSVTRLGGCRPRTIQPHGGRLLQTHECSSATRGTRPGPAPREGRAPCEPERPWGFPHHVAVRPTCRRRERIRAGRREHDRTAPPPPRRPPTHRDARGRR